MKIRFSTVALLAVLSIAAAGCQKETTIETNLVHQQNVIIRNIVYTIDGVTGCTVIRGEDKWGLFVDRMLALARAGHSVSFYNADKNADSYYAKDKVTYKTTDGQQARNWAQEMSEEGYRVTIEFDSNTGVYICTAVK